MLTPMLALLCLSPDAVGGTTGDAPVPLETILKPSHLERMIQGPVFDGNLAWAKSEPHVEAAFRAMYAADQRLIANDATLTADEIAQAQSYRFVLSVGRSVGEKMDYFHKPRAKGGAKEDEVPNWVDAARLAFVKVGRDAIIGAQADIHAKIKSGEIKSTGLPDGLNPENFFYETIENYPSPQTMLTVDEVKIPGKGDQEGKMVGVGFGWYNNQYRKESNKAKEAKAAKVAAAEAAAKTGGSDAPPPNA